MVEAKVEVGKFTPLLFIRLSWDNKKYISVTNI